MPQQEENIKSQLGSNLYTDDSKQPTAAAKIGSVEYGTLTEAIAAVNDGETIVVNAGTYAITELNGLSNANKAITITAADNATVILNAVDQGDVVYVHGAKITFNGITFNWSNDNYRGFKHASELVYNNCTINGMKVSPQEAHALTLAKLANIAHNLGNFS